MNLIKVIDGKQYRLAKRVSHSDFGDVYTCVDSNGARVGFVGVVSGEMGPVCKTPDAAALRAGNCYRNRVNPERGIFSPLYNDFFSKGFGR